MLSRRESYFSLSTFTLITFWEKCINTWKYSPFPPLESPVQKAGLPTPAQIMVRHCHKFPERPSSLYKQFRLWEAVIHQEITSAIPNHVFSLLTRSALGSQDTRVDQKQRSHRLPVSFTVQDAPMFCDTDAEPRLTCHFTALGS